MTYSKMTYSLNNCSKCKLKRKYIIKNTQINKYLIIFSHDYTNKYSIINLVENNKINNNKINNNLINNNLINNNLITYKDDNDNIQLFDMNINYNDIIICKLCFFNYIKTYYEIDQRYFKLYPCNICYKFYHIDDTDKWVTSYVEKLNIIYHLMEINYIYYTYEFKQKYEEYNIFDDDEVILYMNCCINCKNNVINIYSNKYYLSILPFHKSYDDNYISHVSEFNLLFNNNPQKLNKLCYKAIDDDILKVRLFQKYRLLNCI
jgi:hypothetical protein